MRPQCIQDNRFKQETTIETNNRVQFVRETDFTRNRSWADTIFRLRQLGERNTECNRNMCFTFVEQSEGIWWGRQRRVIESNGLEWSK